LWYSFQKKGKRKERLSTVGEFFCMSSNIQVPILTKEKIKGGDNL
jgi:hypothetical protein